MSQCSTNSILNSTARSPLTGCKSDESIYFQTRVTFIHSSGLHHTFQWSSSCIISGIEWSSSGPYFAHLSQGTSCFSLCFGHIMPNLSNNAHAKYHSYTNHIYPLMEAILFRRDARLISLPSVSMITLAN